MPPLDDNLDSPSSAESDTPDVANAAPAVDANTATSSNAEGAPEGDTLSIVRDVVEAGKTDPAATSPVDGSEAALAADETATTDKKEPAEDYSDVPFHKHPRFKQLLGERDTFKADAGRYQNIQTFMDTNGISNEEAADGFVIMAKMKTDPAGAWAMLKPIVSNLLAAAGEILPDDLKQFVAEGKMSHEAALETSRARASVQAVKVSQTFEQQRTETQQRQQHQTSLFNEATSWEADRRLKDPNFEAKAVPLRKELAFIQANEGKPTTPEGVRDQLNRAYKAIVLPAQPKPVVRIGTQTPVGSGQVSGQAQPQPKSTMDIINSVVGQRH